MPAQRGGGEDVSGIAMLVSTDSSLPYDERYLFELFCDTRRISLGSSAVSGQYFDLARAARFSAPRRSSERWVRPATWIFLPSRSLSIAYD